MTAHSSSVAFSSALRCSFIRWRNCSMRSAADGAGEAAAPGVLATLVAGEAPWAKRLGLARASASAEAAAHVLKLGIFIPLFYNANVKPVLGGRRKIVKSSLNPARARTRKRRPRVCKRRAASIKNPEAGSYRP